MSLYNPNSRVKALQKSSTIWDQLTTDGSGNLYVNLAAGGGSGGTSNTDGSAFTVNTSVGTPIMGVVNPVDTPTDGTLDIAALDSSRRLKVAGSFSATPVTSNTASAAAQTTVGTTAGQVLAANSNRKRMIFQNVGTTVIKLVLGAGTPTQTAFHRALPAGGTADDGSSPVYSDDMWTGAVQAISSAAGGLLVVTELT